MPLGTSPSSTWAQPRWSARPAFRAVPGFGLGEGHAVLYQTQRAIGGRGLTVGVAMLRWSQIREFAKIGWSASCMRHTSSPKHQSKQRTRAMAWHPGSHPRSLSSSAPQSRSPSGLLPLNCPAMSRSESEFPVPQRPDRISKQASETGRGTLFYLGRGLLSQSTSLHSSS
jgi:hypothetical protein